MKRYYAGIRKPFVRKGWSRAVLIFTVTVLLLLLVRTFFFLHVEVSRPCPELGLLEGDRMVVNRMAYGIRMPLQQWFGYHRWGEMKLQRGDWVVFDAPFLEQRICMDKVTRLPGDTLWLTDEKRDYMILPEGTFGVCDIVLSDSCLIGSPCFVSYSLDTNRSFLRQLRLDRFFLWIK